MEGEINGRKLCTWQTSILVDCSNPSISSNVFLDQVVFFKRDIFCPISLFIGYYRNYNNYQNHNIKTKKN